MRLTISIVFFLLICSFAKGQRIDTKWYSETACNGVIIQNSYLKGGPYTGPTYLLVDAANSSATFFLANGLQQNKIATIISRETGDNRKGTNGGNLFFLRLPHSKIEIDIPLISYYPLLEQPDDRLTPDIIVVPKLKDVKNKKDVVLEQALELIVQG